MTDLTQDQIDEIDRLLVLNGGGILEIKPKENEPFDMLVYNWPDVLKAFAIFDPDNLDYAKLIYSAEDGSGLYHHMIPQPE